MPSSIECPSCSAQMTVPADAAGKRVRCPKCQKPVAVPAPADEDDFEVVEDDAPARAASKSSKRRAAEEDEEDERPRKKKAAVHDDEDEDDRPRAKKDRRHEDDDDDDRPRKRSSGDRARKRRGGSGDGPKKALILGGVAVTVAVVVAGGVMFFKGKMGAPAGGPGGLGSVLPTGGPPPNYSAVREPGGMFAVYLPGQANKWFGTENGQDMEAAGSYHWSSSVVLEQGPGGRRLEASVSSRRLKNGYNPGTTPEQLLAALREQERGARVQDDQELVSQRAIVLGGLPGLECRVKKIVRKSKPNPREDADPIYRAIQQAGREDNMHVYYITHNGKQLFVIKVETRRDFPPDETLKIITDSFTIL
ncbi:MJ0042-type zinc finger domain-containing protein [Limnoglobus roseus]|uniref:NINE protein n=1 Tax=Limnoglobus roseus TaxID=2598579 RepID=A0A5C1AB00_9BACT|nr:MJ0042-type zinc finger domain-containing protein [Limnoglobus roseus]QEL15755.1 NINE protein [Limnoglobus roseus]